MKIIASTASIACVCQMVFVFGRLGYKVCVYECRASQHCDLYTVDSRVGCHQHEEYDTNTLTSIAHLFERNESRSCRGHATRRLKEDHQ